MNHPQPQPFRYFYFAQDSIHELSIHEPQMRLEHVPEKLIHHIWQEQFFSTKELKTISGEPIILLNQGVLNERHDGPDFRHAHLLINNQEFKGDIEIHLTSKNWKEHNHQIDKKYNSVVLHVVLQEDASTGKLQKDSGETLNELVLLPYLKKSLRPLLFDFLQTPKATFLCQPQWHQIPLSLLNSHIPKLASVRISQKIDHYQTLLKRGISIENIIYVGIFRALGYYQNADNMEILAQSLPLEFQELPFSSVELEALFLGAARLLPSTQELLHTDRETADYAMKLKLVYDDLIQKFEFPTLDALNWHFGKVRPSNTPIIRVVQALALFQKAEWKRNDMLKNLFDVIQQPNPLLKLRELFKVQLGAFWDTHYTLTKRSQPKAKTLGRQRVDTILLNVILPAIGLYSRELGYSLTSLILTLFKQIPQKTDHIIAAYKHPNLKINNGLTHQAIHQLARENCSQAKCLSCPIGNYILSS